MTQDATYRFRPGMFIWRRAFAQEAGVIMALGEVGGVPAYRIARADGVSTPSMILEEDAALAASADNPCCWRCKGCALEILTGQLVKGVGCSATPPPFPVKCGTCGAEGSYDPDRYAPDPTAPHDMVVPTFAETVPESETRVTEEQGRILGAIRTYDQLDEHQQENARASALESLLGAILEGGLRFDDELNHDDLQARIDAACQKANDMQTPWFSPSYIMDVAGDEITGMAECDAQDALYCTSPEVRVVDLAPPDDPNAPEVPLTCAGCGWDFSEEPEHVATARENGGCANCGRALSDIERGN